MKLTPRQVILMATALTYFYDVNAATFSEQHKEELMQISKLLNDEYAELTKDSV